MILISHDLGVIAEVAETVAVMYAGKIVERAKPDIIFSRPRHPYTVGLLNSMPGRGVPKRRLQAIPGMVPNPLDWPSGCHFRDRCLRADADCVSAEPPLVEIETHHDVACFKVA